MSTATFTPTVGEHGKSQSHRAEARRIALETHVQLEQQGGVMNVGDGIALGRLHAELALLDSLDEIRAAMGILATASRS